MNASGSSACGRGRRIGRESGEALEEVLGSGIEINDHPFLRLRAARRRLGKGSPGSRLFQNGLSSSQKVGVLFPLEGSFLDRARVRIRA
jgi:hypothetical protein